MPDTKTPAFPPQWHDAHPYVLPQKRVIRCCLFWAQKANPITEVGFMKDDGTIGTMWVDLGAWYFETAKKVLAKHNMDIEACTSPKKAEAPAIHHIPFKRYYHTNSPRDIQEVRGLCHDAHAAHGPHGRIPIIFCPFQDGDAFDSKGRPKSKFQGHAPKKSEGHTWDLRFVVINTENYSSDAATLLHEVGHAAELEHPDPMQSRADPVQNLMNWGNGENRRTDLLTFQVEAFAKAYFTGPP